MLITVSNPDLYRAWIAYFERTSQMSPPEMRTYAFFYSDAAKPVPLM